MKMRTILLNLAIIFLPVLVFGQYAYDNGLIITKECDTIKCLVPLEVTYGDKIIIKVDGGSKKKVIKSSDIKYLATKYNIFENVSYTKKKKEKEALMQIVIEGFVYLYLKTTVNTGTSYSGNGGIYTMNTSPTLEYVVKKNDSTHYIKKNKFQETIIPLINDATELVEKIENKEFKYGDLEEIIKEYNKTKAN